MQTPSNKECIYISVFSDETNNSVADAWETFDNCQGRLAYSIEMILPIHDLCSY